MNKIFRKCRDFGIMIDLSSVEFDSSIPCVKALKKANIPLCTIDKKRVKDWQSFLRNIAFNEDLFIAVENIETIEEAYEAAGNGAQFFIFNKFDLGLYNSLSSYGFFFIPFVNSKEEEEQVLKLGLEVVSTNNYEIINNDKLYKIKRENISDISNKLEPTEVFKLVSIPTDITDYEDWANIALKSFLSIKYSVVELESSATEDIITFAKLFAATNRCKTEFGTENSLTLTCSDFIRTVNYLKWREFYIDPLNVTQNEKGLYRGILDTQLNNFTIKIEEVDEY